MAGGRLGLELLVAALVLGVACDMLFRGRPLGGNVIVCARLFMAERAGLLAPDRAQLDRFAHP